jgi:hypothetical protein
VDHVSPDISPPRRTRNTNDDGATTTTSCCYFVVVLLEKLSILTDHDDKQHSVFLFRKYYTTTMVKGRPGMYLEAWKFGVYISIPIFASWYYSFPETQQYWADYWQYIKYPENPNTNVKQKIKELGEQKGKEREQRMAYQQQLRELQLAAERSENYQKESAAQENKPSLWGRAGG